MPHDPASPAPDPLRAACRQAGMSDTEAQQLAALGFGWGDLQSLIGVLLPVILDLLRRRQGAPPAP